MRAFRDVFRSHHVFLPVIHVIDKDQTVRNVGIAMENGANGVFLINHNIPASRMIGCYAAARAEFPRVWMGLNFLDFCAIDAQQRLPGDADGLWCDNGGVTSADNEEGIAFDDLRKTRQGNWLYFGGVAFKGQDDEADPAGAARYAKPLMDVVTTSGQMTGFAPAADKIALMKNAVGEHPLAIASGISIRNIDTFLPWADCFLVASSIVEDGSFTEFCPKRLRELAGAIH